MYMSSLPTDSKERGKENLNVVSKHRPVEFYAHPGEWNTRAKLQRQADSESLHIWYCDQFVKAEVEPC